VIRGGFTRRLPRLVVSMLRAPSLARAQATTDASLIFEKIGSH
jgi:hypothetical protein